jgi:hypothetical protein
MGEYPIGQAGTVLLSLCVHTESNEILCEEEVTFRTRVRSFFDSDDNIGPQAARRLADQEAEGLLGRVNRLLRWYRVLAARPEIADLTLPDLSPFVFTLGETDTPWSVPTREFGRPELPPTGHVSVDDIEKEVRRNLATGTDPDPALLTLLDAEQAMRVGRFRDAVLLSWSVIDSSVVQAFESLVDQKLTGEWSESLDFLKGADFGLRHKMTGGLKLLCGRSLFEDKAAWQSLSESYRKRNEIIHRNQKADATDARNAVQVARRVLSFLQDLRP